MNRKLLIVGAVALFFLAGGWTLRNQLEADREGDWVRVTRGDLVTGVDVGGTLASAASGLYGPPGLHDVWDFKISMLAPEGSEVKAGDPIIGFDTTDLQKLLDEKSAEAEQAAKEIEKRRADLRVKREDEMLNLAEAQATLRKTQLKLDAPADIVSVKERKQVELDFALAKREVAETKARIDDLQRAASAEIALLESKRQRAAAVVAETRDTIAHMTVRAPRAGTVVYVTNWRGDKKKIGDTCWRTERIVEIPDLTHMVAHGEIDEVDAGRVAVGQRVTLRLDSHPDEELHGTIVQTAKTVQQRPQTTDPMKILRVDIALDRSDPANMRPGMRFQGTIELTRKRGALLVPREAVAVSPGGPVVTRRGALGAETVPLRAGGQNAKFVEVLSGLADGDRVLIGKAKEEKDKS